MQSASFYKHILFLFFQQFFVRAQNQWFPNCACVAPRNFTVSRKLSKISFRNCQNFPFQTVKISFSELSKFPFPNCQNFLFQTVKIFLFRTVKIFLFKLLKFPFKTVKIFLLKLSKYSFPNCQNFPFPNCQNFPFSKLSKFCILKSMKKNCFVCRKIFDFFSVSRLKKFGNHWIRSYAFFLSNDPKLNLNLRKGKKNFTQNLNLKNSKNKIEVC